MSDTLKKLLIFLPVGALCAFLVSWSQGLFGAETARDVYRILSDGFFVAGGLSFCYGGLVWTSNGGVWDGLLYSGKMAFGRVKRDFEDEKLSFGEYKEQRAAKASSPKVPLLAGILLLIVATVFLALYSYL